ncbi:MAG: hypothetical protein RLZZ292_3662 [Bacteroidota bacterium]|jgi:1,4-dihydroxy-2-naphthoyl-CoA hydrolase
MAIWKSAFDLESLNAINGKETIGGYIGIEFTEFGDDYLIAKMPVDHRTRQPMGLLHGGASVVLAETLGSVASVLCLEDWTKKAAVGLEINANHLSSARNGWVYGTVKPIRVGRTVHVWNIEIRDEKGKMICISRLTTSIIDI